MKQSVQFDASAAPPAAKPERRWSGCAIGDCGTFVVSAPLAQPAGELEAQIRAFEAQRPSFDPDSYVYRQGRVVQFVRDATKSTKEFLSFIGNLRHRRRWSVAAIKIRSCPSRRANCSLRHCNRRGLTQHSTGLKGRVTVAFTIHRSPG